MNENRKWRGERQCCVWVLEKGGERTYKAAKKSMAVKDGEYKGGKEKALVEREGGQETQDQG